MGWIKKPSHFAGPSNGLIAERREPKKPRLVAVLGDCSERVSATKFP